MRTRYKISFVFCVSFLIALLFIGSCKKKEDPGPVVQPPGDSTIVPAVDPPVAQTMGFFLDNWTGKTFVAPSYAEENVNTGSSTTITVDASNVITKIPNTIYGHNANTWMTQMSNEPVFMNHITNLQPHVVRFPAGSGSDAYFFNSKPGALPADVPVQLIDKDGNKKDPGYGYGKTTDNWRASLDNYYEVLAQTNSIGVLTMNYGYARYGLSANPVAAAAHLAAEWVRYDNGRTAYWEIGNEVYGDWEWGYRIDQSVNKDGQPALITGKLYAQHFKVFADSMRKAATEKGKTIYIGAVMYESPGQSWQALSFQNWNKTMIPEMNNVADFYIGHNYFTPYNENSTASVVLTAATTQPATMMSFMTQQLATYNATVKPIAMTEWNMFATGSKQQVSNTSGVFAVLVLGEALTNKFGLSARWDLLNSWANGDDHGLFSDGSEPGVAKWSPRPSFYYLYFLQKTMGDRLVGSTVSTGSTNIKAYASTFTSGQAGVAVANTGATAQTVTLKMKNFKTGKRYYWYSLEGSDDNGEFSRKVLINGTGPTAVAGGPSDYATLKAKSALTTNAIKIMVPARGVVFVVVDK